MKWHRTIAIARKELICVLRDRGSLYLTFITPLFMLISFGYSLSVEVKHVQLLIIDESDSVQSRELIRDFKGSSYFDVKIASTPSLDALDRGIATMELVIPIDFSAKEGSSSLQLLVDGSDSNRAIIALGYVQAVIERFQSSKQNSFDLRSRVLFNEALHFSYGSIPALIPVVMLLVGHLLTALTIAGQFEKGTLELIAATPARSSEIVVGTLIPYFALSFLNMALLLILSQYLFTLPMRGSWITVVVCSMIFCMTALIIGLFFSILAKNQLLAYELVMVLTLLPAFNFSGFSTDLHTKGEIVRLISSTVPARYLISILRDIYLKGVGWSVIAPDCIALIICSLFFLFLSIKLLKKEMIS